VCICITGCGSGHDSAKNGAVRESEDNDLDLSEADFAPADCSVLLRPCAINGNELDSAAFNTAVSDLTFPACDERLVIDGGGMLGSHPKVTSSGVQNTDASARSAVQYDAIGLPLFTEKVAGYETVTCHYDALDVAAESSNNRVVKNDLDGNIMSSHNTLHDAAVTTDSISPALAVFSANLASLAASDGYLACEDGKELASSHGSGENITCVKSDAVEVMNVRDEDIDSGVSAVNAGDDQECINGSSMEPSLQNTETVNWDVTDAQAPVDEFRDISVPSARDVITSQGEEVQGEEMDIACGDSHVTPLSPMMTEETNDTDDGIDEVDKTVPNLYRTHSTTTSTNVSFDAGAPCHDHDRLLDDRKTSTDLDGGGTSRVKKEFDETCGIDHVERFTGDGVSMLRVRVKIDSRTEVLAHSVVSPVECISESGLVVNAQKTMDVSEVTEIGSYDKDGVTSRVPMQSDVQFPVDTDHPAASLPCSVSAVDSIAADVVESGLSRLEEIPMDVADGKYDVPAADDEKQVVDSLESLQKHVSEEVSVSGGMESREVRDIIWPSSVNDAGGDAELHHKPSKQSEDDGVDSIALDAEPSAQSETTLAKESPDMEEIDGLEASSSSSDEPDVPEVDFSALGEKEDEQAKCGLSNNVVSELGGQIEAKVNADSLPVAHAVDIGPFSAGTGDSLHAGIGDIEIGKSVVYTRAETQTPSTDDKPAPDQEQRQSDEDAEKWFEEQFAACEDFDVDEFVSSAWSTFHSDSEPAVSSIHDEMLEQSLAAGDGGVSEPVQLDTADAWHYVENAAVAASAVDDSCQPSSSEYLDGETELATCYPPSSSSSQPQMTQTVPSLPGKYLITDQISVHFPPLFKHLDTVW